MFTEMLLPAFVSAVVVFFTSFTIWMVIKWHDKDIRPLPDEAGFLAKIREMNLPGGTYLWPLSADAKTKEEKAAAVERHKAGPWGNMTIIGPRGQSFVQNLLLTLLCYLAISFATAGVLYYGYRAQETDVSFMDVAWLGWLVAVPAYCIGGMPHLIFFGYSCRFKMTALLDGLIFGVLTGLVFAILW